MDLDNYGIVNQKTSQPLEVPGDATGLFTITAIDNFAGATYNLYGAASIVAQAGFKANMITFTNAGTVNKQPPPITDPPDTATIGIDFSNEGNSAKLNVLGGTLALAGSAIQGAGITDIATGATLKVFHPYETSNQPTRCGSQGLDRRGERRLARLVELAQGRARAARDRGRESREARRKLQTALRWKAARCCRARTRR